MKSHDIHLDLEYTQWISDVKERYRKAQIKAAVRVNAEQLLFNWQLGRDLVIKKAEEKWGSGVVEQVSLDLKAEFLDVTGFSTTNLWYMKNCRFGEDKEDRSAILSYPPAVLYCRGIKGDHL